MDKIPSFTIDHQRLSRGVFVSRKDVVGQEVLTTFDIRMKLPNREPALDGRAIHTIEHLAATYLRNDAEWKDRIIYWGPMGCLTGNYLILKGDVKSYQLLPVLRRTFAFIADFEGEIPGATAKDCGNYTYNDLPLAKAEARQFLENTLTNPLPEQLRYPSAVVYAESQNIKQGFAADAILHLAADEVFVFGSNLQGRHHGGAARLALQMGAVMGKGVGHVGQTYAIPTMQGGVDTIRPYVDEFITYAQTHPEYRFLVTKIGCGIAGFNEEEIAPLFADALEVPNIYLPASFFAWITQG